MSRDAIAWWVKTRLAQVGVLLAGLVCSHDDITGGMNGSSGEGRIFCDVCERDVTEHPRHLWRTRKT